MRSRSSLRTLGTSLALSLLCTGSLAARAQDWAKARLDQSPRHGEYVTLDEPSGRKLQAWVVYPEVKGKAPVVVMIHEIFGLTDWAREMADELAAAGYIVVEPDLLSGFGPAAASAPGSNPTALPAPGSDHMHNEMPGMNMAGSGAPYQAAQPGGTAAFADQGATVRAVSSLPDPQVLTDLDTAANYGKHLPAANGKLFVAGFCYGGGKSFLFATHRKDLSGSFVFYGPPPATDLLKNINAPVYGFYAANDARITSTLDGTKTAMAAAHKTFEPTVYDGAGHGFMRAGEAPDASPANADARKAALQRTLQVLSAAH